MPKIYVISGGPGTGKTTTINALKQEGYKIINEAARFLSLNDERFKGKTIKQIEQKEFQNSIFELQKQKLNEISDFDGAIFTDRGFGDTIAYSKLRIGKVPDELIKFAKKARYSGVFILDILPNYDIDELRTETTEEREKIHNTIVETYEKLGYKPVIVPVLSVEERVKFIKEKIDG